MKRRPRAEVITIGEEILNGSVLNTNAKFLGRELSALGFKVHRQVSCRDKVPPISYCLSEAMNRSDVIILTGGLGPTPDDVTRDAVASYFGVRLVLSETQFDLIQSHYRKYAKTVPEAVRREALFPEGSTPLVNRFGVALGFALTQIDKIIIVLPGVPRELEMMYFDCVKEFIARYFPHLSRKHSYYAKLMGISEAEIMEKLKKDFFNDVFDFGIYPDLGEVTVRLQSEEEEKLKNLVKKFRARLKNHIVIEENKSVSAMLGDLLRAKNRTVAAAESCSGGVFSQMLTNVPGASDYFLGSVVAYDNRVKNQMLQVPLSLLAEKGAVSAEVAKILAVNVRKKFKSDYGVSITGIAGPGGGTKTKPVGLVYIGIATSKGIQVHKENFNGDREQIRICCAKRALLYLWKDLKKN